MLDEELHIDDLYVLPVTQDEQVLQTALEVGVHAVLAYLPAEQTVHAVHTVLEAAVQSDVL